MKKTIYRLLVFGSFCFLFSDLGMAQGAEEISVQQEIKIGILLPETGSTAWVKSAYAGIDLAMEEINAAGGPLGKKFTYIKGDTQSSGPIARKILSHMIRQGVLAVVGPTSGEIFDCLEIVEKNRLVLISPTAGTSKLDDIKGRWIFRTTSSDHVMALGVAVEARLLGLKRGATFCANTGSGRSIGGAVNAAFTRSGGEMVEHVIFDEGKVTYRSELKQLLLKKPDIVFWEASSREAKIIFTERKDLELGGVWIGSDYMNENLVREVAETVNIDGMLGIAPAPSPGPRLNEWLAAIRKYADSEGVPAFSAQAYDAVMIIALAIEASGQADREGLYPYIRKVSNPPGTEVFHFKEGAMLLRSGEKINYSGMAGYQDFDECGDVIVDHVIRQVKNGRLEQIGVLSQDELSQYMIPSTKD